jgi:PAS domain S-box-containing protein
MTGKRIQQLMTVPGQVFFDTHFAPLLRIQGFVKEIACDLVRPHAAPLPVLMNAVQVSDGDGHPTLLRFTIFDATERRRYEGDLLRTSQRAERAAAIVEASADAIVSVDAEGLVRTWNAAAQFLFGYKQADAIGRPIADLIVPVDPTDRDAIQVDLTAGRIIRGEKVYTCKDGHRVDVQVTLTPHMEPPNEFIGFSAIYRDNNERRKWEAQQAHLSAIVESSLDAIYTYDLEGRLLTWNRSAERLYGHRPHEIIGQNVAVLFPPDKAHELPLILKNAAAGKPVFDLETFRKRKNGTQFTALLTTTPIRAADGTVTSVAVVVRDITQRRGVEEALRQSEHFLQRITTVTPDVVYVMNVEDLSIKWVNPQVAGVMGYTSEQVLSMGPRFMQEIMHPDDMKQMPDHFADLARADDGETLEIEYRLRRPDGTWRWYRGRKSPFTRDEQGRVTEIIGTSVDITERATTEHALRASEQRMRLATAATGVGIWEWNILTNDVRWDAEMFRIYGIEPTPDGSVRYPVYSGALFSDDRLEQEALLQQRVIHGGQGARRFRIVRATDGSVRHIRSVEAVRTNEEGIAEWVVGTNLDVTDREIAEEALRKLAAIVETSDDAILSRDLGGSITSWNKAAERIFGHTAEEMLGKPIEQIIPPELGREEDRLMARLIAGERVEHYETTRLRKDGSRVQVALTVSPLRNEAGEIIGMSKVLRDITESKRAQLALYESEERFHLLADNIAQLAWMAEPDGEINWYNKQWFEFTGTTLDEMRGWGWQKVHHSEHVERVTEKFKRHMQEELVWEDTFPIRGADGEYRWFLSRAIPVRDALGHVLRWFGTNTDITDERNAREELLRSEERRRLLADNMSQMAYVADGEGTITWVNRRWIEYTGLDADDVNNGGWARVVDPEHFASMGASYALAQERGEPWEHVFRLKSTDGSYRWFLSRSMPIKDEQGKVVRWFGTNTDINEQKLAEEALEESSRHKDHFLATLAHELRNPLAPLKNGLQLLELAPDDADLMETTRVMMVRQLDHMVRLVDDLMDLSRISRGKIRLAKDKVQLSEVVATAMEASRPFIERMGHTFDVNIGSGSMVVNGDLARLIQVVSNLLNNAAKYTPPGGRIELDVSQDGGQAAIRIRDNGIGIDAAALPHVFDMFAQVDPEQKGQAQGGLGIGLNIGQRLVHMHSGTVEGRSEGLGKGSEFTVRLPVEAEVLKHAPAPVTPTTSAAARRVMVVDDNEDIALSTTLILKKLGHQVVVAHDGEHAVELAEQSRPEVILMDIGMPKMNGYDACARIRSHDWGKHMHIIAVSGWGQEEDRKRSTEAGFDAHVVKPIERFTLERVVAGSTPHLTM